MSLGFPSGCPAQSPAGKAGAHQRCWLPTVHLYKHGVPQEEEEKGVETTEKCVRSGKQGSVIIEEEAVIK